MVIMFSFLAYLNGVKLLPQCGVEPCTDHSKGGRLLSLTPLHRRMAVRLCFSTYIADFLLEQRNKWMSMRVQYLKLCDLIGNIRIDAVLGKTTVREAMRFSAYLWQPHKVGSHYTVMHSVRMLANGLLMGVVNDCKIYYKK